MPVPAGPVKEAAMDLIVKGGRVVTPDETAMVDIGVKGGKIVAIAAPDTLTTDDARVVDVRGKVVVPGGIEPHCHIGQAYNTPPSSAGPLPTSKGAAFGGVTTIFDFCFVRPGFSVPQAIDERKATW